MSDWPNLNDVAPLVEAYLDQRQPPGVSLLYCRSEERGMLLRLNVQKWKPVVVKLWRSRDIRERVKLLCGVSNGAYEWRMHQYIARIGLNVANPIAYGILARNSNVRLECFVVQDLGKTVSGVEYLKKCLLNGEENTFHRLEDFLIDSACLIVSDGIIDIDHHLNNIVVDCAGKIFRVDFECVRRYRRRAAYRQRLSQMISRMICSHVYACQPDIAHSQDFAIRLASRLMLPAKLLSQARAHIENALEQQRKRLHIDSRLQLPW